MLDNRLKPDARDGLNGAYFFLLGVFLVVTRTFFRSIKPVRIISVMGQFVPIALEPVRVVIFQTK